MTDQAFNEKLLLGFNNLLNSLIGKTWFERETDGFRTFRIDKYYFSYDEVNHEIILKLQPEEVSEHEYAKVMQLEGHIQAVLDSVSARISTEEDLINSINAFKEMSGSAEINQFFCQDSLHSPSQLCKVQCNYCKNKEKDKQ